MRLYIIRHGVPDYRRDTLTEAGWREAALLGERLSKLSIDRVYLSPLGRAQDTAAEFLRRSGQIPEVLPWLCEFDGRLPPPYNDRCSWHQPPSRWAANPDALGPHWRECEPFVGSDFLKRYESDEAELNALLASLGYVREGIGFRIDPKWFNINENLAFFCHYGRGAVLLSQLLQLPFFTAAHQFWLPTSSVTEVIFERDSSDRSYAIARVAQLGSVSHLESAGIPRCNSAFLMPIDGYTEQIQTVDTQAKV